MDFDVPGLIDVKYEEDGDWFEHAFPTDKPSRNKLVGFRKLLDEDGNGLKRVKVRSSHSKPYTDAIDRITRQMMKMTKAEAAEYEPIANRRAFCEHLLMDWDFVQRDGQVIESTMENKMAVMEDNRYRDYQRFIRAAVLVIQGDYDQSIEDDEGN